MCFRSVSNSRDKNLHGFSPIFHGEEFINIFIGKNGGAI